VRSVLDAYEQVLARHANLRPGTLVVEHAFLADATQRARAVSMGVAITVQHPLLYSLGGELVTRWGAERAGRVFPIRSWLEAGANVSAGSDSPPSYMDPMLSIWGMVTRGTQRAGIQGPEQAIDRYSAVRLSTTAGAELDWEQSFRGALEPGRLADLVAYSADPLTCPTDDLPSLKPVLTIVGGKAVYDTDKLMQ
jgi:predicted amidohydrolase YtcJ